MYIKQSLIVLSLSILKFSLMPIRSNAVPISSVIADNSDTHSLIQSHQDSETSRPGTAQSVTSRPIQLRSGNSNNDDNNDDIDMELLNSPRAFNSDDEKSFIPKDDAEMDELMALLRGKEDFTYTFDNDHGMNLFGNIGEDDAMHSSPNHITEDSESPFSIKAGGSFRLPSFGDIEDFDILDMFSADQSMHTGERDKEAFERYGHYLITSLKDELEVHVWGLPKQLAQEVATDFSLARKMMRRVLTAYENLSSHSIDTQENRDLYNIFTDYFPAGNEGLSKILKYMKQMLEQRKKINVVPRARKPCEGNTCIASTLVNNTHGLIYIDTSNYFPRIQTERAGTIIHELSHQFGTKDQNYRYPNGMEIQSYGREICKLLASSELSLTNADSINFFIQDAYTNMIRGAHSVSPVTHYNFHTLQSPLDSIGSVHNGLIAPLFANKKQKLMQQPSVEYKQTAEEKYQALKSMPYSESDDWLNGVDLDGKGPKDPITDLYLN